MGLLEGTNLHGATLDRRRQWEEEWGTVNGVLGDQLIWSVASHILYLFYSLHLRRFEFHSIGDPG